MQNQIIHINDYTLILNRYRPKKGVQIRSRMLQSSVGFVFYGSGDALIEIGEGRGVLRETKRSGSVSVFYGVQGLPVFQSISAEKPVQKVALFIKPERLRLLAGQDKNIQKHLSSLLDFRGSYIKLSSPVSISPSVRLVIDRLFDHSYTGALRQLYLESKINELLLFFFKGLHFTGVTVRAGDKEKLHHARELLMNRIDSPPSLQDLSALTGLNTYKLKKGFKALFGMPVYKYLQNKRLEKAFELLENNDFTVQEVAWYVGYESIGSFSNAFYKKFGYRPSEISKNSFSDKK